MADGTKQPTRLSLAAKKWGESAPKNNDGAKKLYKKGVGLLNQYRIIKLKKTK